MSIFANKTEMSIWEISCRMAGIDPFITIAPPDDQLFRDTIFLICDAYLKNELSAYSRPAQGESPDSHQIVRQQFEQALSSRQLSGLNMTSIHVNRWDFGVFLCKQKLPLPRFWFSDQDQEYFEEEANKSDEVRMAEISRPLRVDLIPTYLGIKDDAEPDLLEQLQPKQIDRLVCQVIAKKLWQENPSLSYAELKKHDDMQRYGNSAYYGLPAFRRWFAKLAPASATKKGRQPKGETT